MMTTSGDLMDTHLQTAFSTPSRIPVLTRKCLLLSGGGYQGSGQENRDPKKVFGAQKDLVSPRHKLKQQTVGLKGNLRPRAPLEEISPGSVGQNVEADPLPRPGTALRSRNTALLTVDYGLDRKEPATARSTGRGTRLMDPGDLATRLSSVEVTSSGHSCQTGLAQRVLIRGKQNQKGTLSGVQVHTPGRHTKSSFFSSNQESPGGNVISQTQMGGDSGQPWARTRLPAHQPPGEPNIPAYSKVLNSSPSGLETHSLAQQVPLEGTHEAPLSMDSPSFPWISSPQIQFTAGQVGHASPFGLASRVPVTHPSTLTSYSVVRHLSVFSRTPQVTPASTPSVQQERIVVKQLYKESWASPEKEPEKPSPMTPLNRMSLELRRHEAGPRDIGVAAPTNSMSLELSRHEMDPRDVGVATSSNTMSLELSRHERINILKQLLQQEVEGLAKVEDGHQSGMSHRKMIEPKLAMIPCITEPSDHGSSLPSLQGPKQHPDVGESISTGGPGIQELIQQPNVGMCTTASTNLTFFQCPLCGSIPLHSLDSLRSPMGTIGPAVLALCQQLNAWLEAIRLLYEGCLDDECAFYTGRGIPGPQRICKNPVATWLERQEAMVNLTWQWGEKGQTCLAS
ncbi:tastin isoform X2 [Trichosurus vulpecula]|uniref:tastin isoform X2 n=1 Tax=Trichosurus vulpecula TaxID=9337 RepID=UPI00186AC0F4|nr:tastin isoform X2 [Trichosurus vulpecula]